MLKTDSSTQQISSYMKMQANRSFLIALSLICCLPAQALESEMAQVKSAEASTVDAKISPRAYVLKVKGRALPLKAATIDGVNVLGSPIVTLSLPVNLSGYVKKGLNELVLDYVSDPKSDLLVTIERRTPGPKAEEVAKITIPAGDSKGEIAQKKINFNIAAGEEGRQIKELTEGDKKAIVSEFENYYQIVKEHRADKLKALYKTALDEERKLCPESVQFFEKVLNRESQVVRNTMIQLPEINKEGLSFKIEGNRVRLFRENNKPLLVSNEIDVAASSVMFEVEKKSKSKAPSKEAKKSQIKEKLVRFNLYFTKSQNARQDWVLTLPPNV